MDLGLDGKVALVTGAGSGIGAAIAIALADEGCITYFGDTDVEAATRELEGRGYKLLVSNRTEPWGQVVSRLISPEGLLVGVTMTPWMREKT